MSSVKHLTPTLRANSYNRHQKALRIAVCLSLILGLSACADKAHTSVPLQAVFYSNVFAKSQDWSHGIRGDISTSSDGYIGISISEEGKYKVQIDGPAGVYNYNAVGDGSTAYYGLTQGEGAYEIRVLRNTEDNAYIEITSRSVEVTFKDEYQPFLHSNAIVNYTANSATTAKAAELAANSSDNYAFIVNVLDYVSKNLSYDYNFAKAVPADYVPDPDSTLASGKGVCYDYASLTAALLRSQGVPCKVITGYISYYYHAWNVVYVEQEGWKQVDYDASNHSWSWVGDARKYSESFVY